jgi:hypothetical protein
LPKEVLETRDGLFFAGFVGQALQDETGPRITSSTKYGKGRKAYQTYSIEKRYGKPNHLRIGGMAKLQGIINEMKGFTKAWWGLRATILTIFKSMPGQRVSHLETFVRAKSDINKHIKTTFKYKNGGLLRPEEIVYLDNRYEAQISAFNAFQARLDVPDADLAQNFETLYGALKTRIDIVNNEVSLFIANRSRIAFPSSKKKSDITFSKKSLSEKLSTMSADKLALWEPTTLPGISKNTVAPTIQVGSPEYIEAAFAALRNNAMALEVIQSWYSGLDLTEQ